MTTSARTKALLGTAAALAAGGVVLVLGPMSGATSSGRLVDAPPTVPTTTEAPTTTAPTTTTTIDDGSLRIGKSGPLVQALQAKLTSLGYWLGPANGAYGLLTEQAVMAFQKVNGLDRDGIAGVTTLAAVAAATARPVPPSLTDGFEVDLARQVIFVVQGGQLLWTFNTSTGKPSTPTNPGDFKVFRQVNGVDPGPVGPLYRPKYFDAGDAIHGSPSIPGYAASHGCARVSNPAMDFLWARVCSK